MLKNIHCDICNRSQNMIEKDGYFTCTACGSKYDLQYIIDSFATPLMCEAIEICLGLEEWQENEENIFIEQFKGELVENEDVQDNTDDEEAFFAAEDIPDKVKTEYCLRNYLYYRIGKEDVSKADFYLKKSTIFDKENFISYLFSALEVEVSSYMLTRNNDQIRTNISTPAVVLADTGGSIAFDEKMFSSIYDTTLAKQLKTVLGLFSSAIKYAPSENLCLRVYDIATVSIDRIRAGNGLLILHNLKESLDSDKYMKYLESSIAIAICHSSLQEVTEGRLQKLGAEKIERNKRVLHFNDDFQDIPSWDYCLCEAEYSTAKEIWDRDVAKYIDPATHQLDLDYSLRAIDGITVVRAILYRLCDHIENLSEMDLNNLLFLRKVTQWTIDVEQEIGNIVVKKETGETISLKLQEDSTRVYALQQKVALIDAELGKRRK